MSTGKSTDRFARARTPASAASFAKSGSFHIPDLKADPAYAAREPLRVVTVEQAGARSFVGVPMLKDGKLVGAIVIYRQEVRPFTEKQIELRQELRRPGRHRHREYAAAQRTAPAHR